MGIYDVENQKNRMVNWERMLDAMDVYIINKKFAAHDINGKYERFISFLHEYLDRLMSGFVNAMPNDVPYQAKVAEVFGSRTGEELPENWWDVAMKIGEGKKVDDNPFPEVSAENKNLILNTFMPIYRTLHDNFQSRWWFEFIFNHDQYVAERDAYRVMTGLMMSLTGDTKEELKADLEAHKKEVPNSGFTAKQRKQNAAEFRRSLKNPQFAAHYEEQRNSGEEFREYKESVKSFKEKVRNEVENEKLEFNSNDKEQVFKKNIDNYFDNMMMKPYETREEYDKRIAKFKEEQGRLKDEEEEQKYNGEDEKDNDDKTVYDYESVSDSESEFDARSESSDGEENDIEVENNIEKQRITVPEEQEKIIFSQDEKENEKKAPALDDDEDEMQPLSFEEQLKRLDNMFR